MLRPPRPTRPDTLVPYTPLCRSLHQREKHRVQHRTFGNVDQPVTFPLVEAKHHPALPLLHAKARPAAASGGGEMWFLHIGSAYPLLGQRMANTVGYEGAIDRKSVVTGKRVSVRVDRGGRRIIKKK